MSPPRLRPASIVGVSILGQWVGPITLTDSAANGDGKARIRRWKAGASATFEQKIDDVVTATFAASFKVGLWSPGRTRQEG